jgi:LacI family transcriptional regulator
VRHTPRVAILVETSRAFGRGILEGVARYVQQHGPWDMYFQPRGLADPPPKWLHAWEGDGILARIDNAEMAKAVLGAGLPALDLRGRLPGLGLTVVGVDNRAVTRLGFEHLADQGFRSFAFCRSAGDTHPHTDECQAYFRKHVEAAGHPYFCNLPPGSGRPDVPWDEEQQRLADWLRGLPKPVGLMACIDDTGFQVLEACRRAGVLVPDEVAVVGANNDTILCDLAGPPMSSIDTNTRQVGYEAAACLARLMRRRASRRGEVCGSPTRIKVRPRGVVVRQSSDVLAIADRSVAAAVHFIRTAAGDGVGVADVLRRVDVSRTVLDQRFKAALGRTVKEEVLRARLSRARRLLSDSTLPLDVVAVRSGFGTAKYMGDAFARELGIRPGEYRRQFQHVG